MAAALGRAVGVVLLALAGLGATFAAAACCALPVTFAALGIAGGAWMLEIALVAGPWQRALLWGGAASLLLALLLLGPRAAQGCERGLCARAGFRAPVAGLVLLGAALAGLSLAAG
jgi:mercuric ion transport protein